MGLVRVKMHRKDCISQRYKVRLTKKFRETHKYNKKTRIWEVLPKEIDAYVIESQTSIATHGDSYKSEFSYRTEGIFENKPSPIKLEKMIKNSMLAAFNSGKSKRRRYIQRDLFGKLVDNGIIGIQIRKKKVKRTEVTNRLRLEMEIDNRGNKWKGEN